MLSVFSGFGDADADLDLDADADLDLDLDADADVDFDADADVDVDGDVQADVVIRQKKYRPWLSFRFYTYTLAIFGLTGVLLSLFGLGETFIGISMSAALGLLSGLGVSYLLYYADRDSALMRPAGDRDFRGAQAEVLLPISKESRGRVRVEVNGRFMDMRAEVEDENVVLDMGDPCFVLDIEDGVAKVIDMKTLESDGLI